MAENGGKQGSNWERYVIGVLITGLVTWVWDIRSELTAVRREQDRRTSTVVSIERILNTQEERAIKLAVIENDIRGIKGRLDIVTKRILSLAERLDGAPLKDRWYQDNKPEETQ